MVFSLSLPLCYFKYGKEGPEQQTYEQNKYYGRTIVIRVWGIIYLTCLFFFFFFLSNSFLSCSAFCSGLCSRDTDPSQAGETFRVGLVKEENNKARKKCLNLYSKIFETNQHSFPLQLHTSTLLQSCHSGNTCSAKGSLVVVKGAQEFTA